MMEPTKFFLKPKAMDERNAIHVRFSVSPRRRVLTGIIAVIFFALPAAAFALGGEQYVSFANARGAFPLSAGGTAAPLCASSSDYPGIQTVLKYFQTDIASVTGARPGIFIGKLPAAKDIVVVGTIGKSKLIDELIARKKIDAAGVAGQREAYLITMVSNPFPRVNRALVIAGSDKRGTIYGMFGITERIGVSPWYWWADVPIQKHTNVYILPGRHTDGSPSVAYRGIFLNDEAPALTGWVMGKYGLVRPTREPPVPSGVANYGREFYKRIFELLLRLKANYLWPAMWSNAFNEDDPENPKLADEYGIVMGTSHQEPMLRAQQEWDRRYRTTLGRWNYSTVPEQLNEFWREGIRRNKNYESIITIGLRGENDTPMTTGGLTPGMDLLNKIIDVQRNILKEEMNPDVTKVPQVWCPYKEVLDYYNAGFRVPDDVTILWTDDNWGNIRRLPAPGERQRSGGAGVYYHFDYHGGPRNYQWINTNTIPKIWDQMSQAKEYGADRIWIVNVGHFKGYELPLSFFMDLAWDTQAWNAGNLDEYRRLWAERQFGPKYAGRIADLLATCAKYNARRKPELLSPTVYSAVDYREADRVVADFKALEAKAEAVSGQLPADARDAFYELVLFPAKASSLLNELYNAAGKNELYASQGRASANEMSAKVQSLFDDFKNLMHYFNRTFAGGRWNHFMDQPVIGYRGWDLPGVNTLKAIRLKTLDVPEAAGLGVAVEGSRDSWPGAAAGAALPPFDAFNRQSYYVDVFNRGKTPFAFSVKADQPWITISSLSGTVSGQTRLLVSVEWNAAPRGSSTGSLAVSGAGGAVDVKVWAFNPATPPRGEVKGFIEGGGYVSVEAEHYTRRTEAGKNGWMLIPDYGRTSSAMRTVAPLDAPAATPGKDSPRLEYRMFVYGAGTVAVEGIFGPTLNFVPGRGLRCAVSFDDETPQVVTLVPENYSAQNGNGDWERTVSAEARYGRSTHTFAEPGFHTLKVWMVDPGVVLEKLIVDLGGVKRSYFGPPESFHANVAND
ncbi:MAG: glycosyl hydrolase 115 family protein [Spirochaetales bacterium]|nr:glycosyl hydrolase 115 family protein [Spirochaetales bacterium]